MHEYIKTSPLWLCELTVSNHIAMCASSARLRPAKFFSTKKHSGRDKTPCNSTAHYGLHKVQGTQRSGSYVVTCESKIYTLQLVDKPNRGF